MILFVSMTESLPGFTKTAGALVAPLLPSTPPLSTPAVHACTIRERHEDGHYILERAGAGKPDCFVQHFHGINGLSDGEWKFAKLLASGKLGYNVTVVMPQSDELIRRPQSEKLMAVFQLARYALDLPPELRLATFGEKNAGLLEKWGNVAHTLMSGVPMWYTIAFDAAGAVTPEPVSSEGGFLGNLSRFVTGRMQAVAGHYLPHLKPNIPNTIPNMLEACTIVRPAADEMLRRLDVDGNLIVSGYSLGVGLAAPFVLLHQQKDTKLAPIALVATNAPIILTHGMPKVRNRRIPIHNVLPRGDGVPDIVLRIKPNDVRHAAEKQNLPIRVYEPPGGHEPSCRLLLAIFRRELEDWAGFRPALA